MFYNFNRHKQGPSQPANPQADKALVEICERCTVLKRRIAQRMNEKVAAIPARRQLAIFVTILTVSILYCLWLSLPGFHGKYIGEINPSLFGKSTAVQTVKPNPEQRGFKIYLDSLQNAFIADSITQSKQNINGHAH